jgi:hypothetical protein
MRATVDIGAILDFTSSFGTIVMNRAYADWSALINASYQWQHTNRAVDLTQLFSTSSLKNGADIRLAVDVIEDVFRLADLTHIIIVAGDSDYIPLAQRCPASRSRRPPLLRSSRLPLRAKRMSPLPRPPTPTRARRP